MKTLIARLSSTVYSFLCQNQETGEIHIVDFDAKHHHIDPVLSEELGSSELVKARSERLKDMVEMDVSDDGLSVSTDVLCVSKGRPTVVKMQGEWYTQVRSIVNGKTPYNYASGSESLNQRMKRVLTLNSIRDEEDNETIRRLLNEVLVRVPVEIDLMEKAVISQGFFEKNHI